MSFSIAVNTSQSQAQLVLFSGSQILEDIHWEKQKSHSEVITSRFEEAIKKHGAKTQDLEKLFCVVGPGSFTGIRVGLNFCKSLAFLSSSPIVPINALDLWATQCDLKKASIVSLIDAQKNSVFVSTYSKDSDRIEKKKSNQIVNISDLKNWVDEGIAICGQADTRYPEIIQLAVEKKAQSNNEWKKADLKNYIFNDYFGDNFPELSWKQLQPVYIKASAPEELLKNSAQNSSP